jgi:hypothetical protein
MTVAELIAKLQELPPDMPVLVWDGYEADLNDATEIEVRRHPWKTLDVNAVVIA